VKENEIDKLYEFLLYKKKVARSKTLLRKNIQPQVPSVSPGQKAET
jgi:hypothetical protein